MDSSVEVEEEDDLNPEDMTLRNIFKDTKRLPPGSGGQRRDRRPD